MNEQPEVVLARINKPIRALTKESIFCPHHVDAQLPNKGGQWKGGLTGLVALVETQDLRAKEPLSRRYFGT